MPTGGLPASPAHTRAPACPSVRAARTIALAVACQPAQQLRVLAALQVGLQLLQAPGMLQHARHLTPAGDPRQPWSPWGGCQSLTQRAVSDCTLSCVQLQQWVCSQQGASLMLAQQPCNTRCVLARPGRCPHLPGLLTGQQPPCLHASQGAEQLQPHLWVPAASKCLMAAAKSPASSSTCA